MEHAHLTTWAVSGGNLLKLAENLRAQSGVEQAVAFGNSLHVSGDDEKKLEQAIAPFRGPEQHWQRIDSGLREAMYSFT